MITDLTIEILALKCNSQDLFNAKIVASANQMISGDKKHTTIMGKIRTTTQRKSKKEQIYGCHKSVNHVLTKIIKKRGFINGIQKSKVMEYIPEDFNTNDIHIAVNNINKLNGIRCYYDGTQIKLKLKGLK